MSTKSDELKGRAKEAAGALSGDQKLEREGQADRAAASAKRKVGEATRKVDKVIDAAKEKVVEATERSSQADGSSKRS
jgi:uncharacterized protein YjbJ (UPF0337 family)